MAVRPPILPRSEELRSHESRERVAAEEAEARERDAERSGRDRRRTPVAQGAGRRTIAFRLMGCHPSRTGRTASEAFPAERISKEPTSTFWNLP